MLNYLKADKRFLRMREFKCAIVHELSVDSRFETFSQHGEDSLLESLFEGKKGCTLRSAAVCRGDLAIAAYSIHVTGKELLLTRFRPETLLESASKHR